MTLPLPQLDTLSYDTLVSEALDQLPYNAPDWTDYNAHDPGITLLELFAWIAEANSYRLDRVPARGERGFLRLVGFPMRPAQAARTVLAFQPGVAVVGLPDGVEVASGDGRVRFQTATPFDAIAAPIAALLTSTAAGWVEHDVGGAAFQPLGAAPAVGDALYVGFAQAPAAGSRVRLFALTGDPARDERTWHALHAEHRRTRRATRPGCRRQCGCLGSLWDHHGARVQWEYHDGTRWTALPDLRDATRALSLSGPLRFRVPADMQPGGVPGHAGSWFIRCRLECGGYDCPPRLTALLLNAVLARHAADNPARAIGKSTGQAGQRFDIAREPIVPGSVEVALTLPDATRTTWSERPDFDRSGPLAREFVVDPTWGQAVFGDGRAGRVPDAGGTLTVTWKTGGGPDGNVPADTLAVAPAALGVAVSQPVAAWGGAAAESPGDAKARAVTSIALARCAVTLRDFEAAALRVPGAPVARAKAVAEFDARLAGLPAAGCVTVVIVSPCVRTRPDPTPGLCRAVRCHLDRRRPVATEVHVAGPQWTTVSAKATLRTRRGGSTAALLAEAVRRIDAFLDPLTGGPDGDGWPFGRPVFRTEVLALLDTLPGVSAVSDLALVADDGPDDRCNNIALCPHGLVRSGTHLITVSPESNP